jgi:hypothetical protein
MFLQLPPQTHLDRHEIDAYVCLGWQGKRHDVMHVEPLSYM